ncbi:Aste57867_25339 [Aphanomyces stellatus]|uniref:Aste57867_25339 protein n=1 Tax=Aphanomyces stellatus TaxID=120398 RepID=A0A485LSU5_9STRA|nr:hypothetical protein As57867_025261 [Aphanomyces stellatus]VFU01964.1 Aste57867_25339 [Aphanomyces stellatus]
MLRLGRCMLLVLGLLYAVEAQNMYCGRRECYDILGLESSATTAQIKKAYRALSLQSHPDKNPSADAARVFQEIATAYEVLSSPLTRQAYDHYLNNPDDHAYNFGMHVYHVYAPQSDYRFIVLGFLVFLSALQYLAQAHRHKQALAYFRQSDEVKRKAQLILLDRTKDDAKDTKSTITKRTKEKKQKKEQARADLERIIDELMATLEISGGYGKPSLSSVLVVRLVVLPLTLARYMAWHITWWYRYRVRGLAYSADDVEYLTCKALGISRDYFWSDQFVEDRDDVLGRALYEPSNLDAYETELAAQWKRKYPKKYKQMLAGRRRAGVPDLEPEPSVDDEGYGSD